MKHGITTLTTCLVLSAQVFVAAAETTNVIIVLPVSKQGLSQEVQSYEQLVQERFLEGIDAIARSPGISSREKNVGRDIYKSLLLFNENKNIEEAETYIQNFCGNPLTTYVGKPVPQNRSEAMFRIYLTEKTRRLLSSKTMAVMEDYGWELLTKYNRGITRVDADKPFWTFSSSENHYVNDRRRYLQALQIVRMSKRYGPDAKLEGASIESHYQAWVSFWIRYFEVRAGQGVDMEIAHPSSYGECTVGVYYDLYDLTDSPRLRELAGKFLTLYWAEVAAEFEPRTGQRAIAATRNPFYDGVRTYWAQSLLYSYGWSDGGHNSFSIDDLMFMLSSYRPPEILSAIARNPNRGAYQTTSRRALLIESEEKEKLGVVVFDKNGDGHFRRDVFYTPEYTLATMTLDPSLKYNNVGDLAQTMGVSFVSAPQDRIVVMGTGFYAKRAINGITGKAVSIIARDPNAQMGRASDYKSFEAFQSSVKDRKFEYKEGKLTYESEAKDNYEYWAMGTQLPKINGAPVNLNPEKTYDSPYLSMLHGSNKAVIKYPGYDDVVLEFESTKVP